MKQRRAAVLLISLLMMATITAATIGISILITSDSQQTRSVEQYIGATLAADSGVERALAVVSAQRNSGTYDTALTQAGVGSRTAIIDSSSPAGYTVAATAASLAQPITLTSGQSYGFDMISNIGGDSSNIPRKMTFKTTQTAAQSPGTIEVSWTLITTQGNTTQQGRAYITKDQYTNSTSVLLDLTNVYLYGNIQQPVNWASVIGYRIRLRAVNNTVSKLTLEPDDLSGLPLDPANPNNVVVKSIKIVSTGQDGDARAEKQVQVIWQRPSSGIFNYVLFSEGDITPSL